MICYLSFLLRCNDWSEEKSLKLFAKFFMHCRRCLQCIVGFEVFDELFCSAMGDECIEATDRQYYQISGCIGCELEMGFLLSLAKSVEGVGRNGLIK